MIAFVKHGVHDAVLATYLEAEGYDIWDDVGLCSNAGLIVYTNERIAFPVGGIMKPDVVRFDCINGFISYHKEHYSKPKPLNLKAWDIIT